MSSSFHAWTDEDGITHVTIEAKNADGRTFLYTLSGRPEVMLDMHHAPYEEDIPVDGWRTLRRIGPAAMECKMVLITHNAKVVKT